MLHTGIDQLVVKEDDDETNSSSGDELSDDENIPTTSNNEIKEEFKNGVEFPREVRRKVKPVPKKLTKQEKKLKTKKTHESERAGHVLPNYAADREKERKLLHIATKGVTKLFNAVSERQKFVEEKLVEMEKGNKAKRRDALEKLKASDLSEQLQKFGRIKPPSKGLLAPKKEEGDINMKDVKEEEEAMSD
uniref:RRP15-like protein n=1 Tax=Acrobeloides nanus TaxID=290746 RepID=A0A914DI21_9BILA